MSPAARWRAVRDLTREARAAHRVMTDTAADGKLRDSATDAYVTAVDRIVVHLGALELGGALERAEDGELAAGRGSTPGEGG